MAIQAEDKSGYASVILVGEHSVVYKNNPAIAMATNNKTTAEIIDGPSESTTVAWDGTKQAVELEKNPKTQASLNEIISVIKNHLGIKEDFGVRITSTIPMGAGLGSSAALGVSLTKAINRHFNLGLTIEQICETAYEVESLMHKTASGIDNTISTYGGVLWYVKGQKPEPIKLGGDFNFVLVHSGVQKQTKDAVAKVAKQREADRAKIDNQFEAITNLVHESKKALEGGDAQSLGKAMNKNHKILAELGVSHPVLDELVEKSLAAGALGAKMTGGGLGGCILVLVGSEEEQENLIAGFSGEGYQSSPITLSS